MPRIGAPAKRSTGLIGNDGKAGKTRVAQRFDMHPKKVTVLKVTGVDLVTLFYFLVSCNTAYLFYCSRLSDKSVSSVSKQLQVFIIANTLISVNLL